MCSIRHKSLLLFFKCLLFASGLVLFGNRLTDRFYLCASITGGMFRIVHDSHHRQCPGHTDQGLRYGKVLASVDKRYHAPLWIGLDAPRFRIVAVAARVVHDGNVLPVSPSARFYSYPSLRGPPVTGGLIF
jgi:hypothetical protein